MAYKHGVQVSEIPTSILPAAEVDSAIPVYFGTAPVNMANKANVNKPILAYTYGEAAAALGFVPAQEDAASGLKKFAFSLSEAMQSQFALHAVAPAIFVNVLDPATHVKPASGSVKLSATTGRGTVALTGVDLDTVVLTLRSAGEESEESVHTYVRGSDYQVSFDDNGYLVIASEKDGDEFICATSVALTVNASQLDPSAVTAADIIGGETNGVKKGLELVNEIFPRFRLVPGSIVAPGFSENPAVAAVMAAKASAINGIFRAVAICDVPADTVRTYSAVAQWKEQNNYTDAFQIVCWPMLSLSGTAYHASTQLAGLLGAVDAENNGTPYVSPSNHNYQMTAAVLADGTEVYLGKEQAEYLNGQGIVTALNFIGGWKCWGNRTGVYPGSTDVKDAFIPIRRMFNWIGNTFIQTFWQRVDAPLNRRTIDAIVDSANIWLNGLASRQYILGGRVEFLESENTTADLMDGKVTFHVFVTPPSPARELDFTLEYDPDYVETLFG